MSIPSHIEDPSTGRKAQVFPDEHALSVAPYPYPTEAIQKTVPFRQYLTSATGSSDMRTTTATDFYVAADPVRDRYITTLSFVIADTSASLSQFGNITALVNGCRLFYTRTDLGEITIADTLQTNWDFVRMAFGQPAFGSASDAFRASNVSGSSEGYIPVLDMTRLLPPYGLQLRHGTTARLVLSVLDNTSGVDAFTCLALGFERLPADAG